MTIGDKRAKQLSTNLNGLNAFSGQVKQIGEGAQKATDERIKADKAKKEKVDADNAKIHATDVATIVRLRNSRKSAGGGFLPPAPSGSSRPDLACFDRTTYQSAYGDLVTGLRGLADEGTTATIDLNTAKVWAQP